MWSLLRLGEQRRGGAGVGALVGQWYQEEESSYESKSQLLIHAHRGGVGQDKQRQGRAVWLVGWCRLM